MSSDNNNMSTKNEQKLEQNQEVKTPEQKTFLQNLIDSVLNAGVNKNIHNIFRIIFIVAILSSIILVFLSGFNIHTIVLTFLISGLFGSVELFNYQLNEIKKEEQEKNKNEKIEDKKNE